MYVAVISQTFIIRFLHYLYIYIQQIPEVIKWAISYIAILTMNNGVLHIVIYMIYIYWNKYIYYAMYYSWILLWYFNLMAGHALYKTCVLKENAIPQSQSFVGVGSSYKVG